MYKQEMSIIFYFFATERKGKCPMLQGVPLCDRECERDEDCEDSHYKCCDQGCGKKTCARLGKCLTLLHSEQPKLHRVLAILSAIGLSWVYWLIIITQPAICRVITYF